MPIGGRDSALSKALFRLPHPTTLEALQELEVDREVLEERVIDYAALIDAMNVAGIKEMPGRRAASIKWINARSLLCSAGWIQLRVPKKKGVKL